MFESLFPTWSNPFAIAILVLVRTLLNVFLTAIVAHAAGIRATLTAVVAAGTVISAVMMVLLLRPGVLGHAASYVEMSLQVGLIAVAGYVVYTHDSGVHWLVAVIVSLGSIAMLVFTIPVYGEAFVAP